MTPRMRDTTAVVFAAPEKLALQRLAVAEPGPGDVVVDVRWSAVSTGTERLLYRGTMPPFPGMGYPLVPGYEAVGRVVEVGSDVGAVAPDDEVFVPGARCFGEVRGLFGGAASRLVVPAARVTRIDVGSAGSSSEATALGEDGVLLALAATAYHALEGGERLPELIVGHGVLGRLLARLTCALGDAPVVWEHVASRVKGARGYEVTDERRDDRRDYRSICDASGDPSLLDVLIARLDRGGIVTLAGFYTERLSFAFPPAFMREAHLRIAAEFQSADLDAVLTLVREGRLELDGLLSHRSPASRAADAYPTAFEDPDCLKMLIDWSDDA